MGRVAMVLCIGVIVLRLLTLPQLKLHDNQLIRVTGTLDQEPKLAEKSQTFDLGQVKIVTARYPEYHYGDVVQVEGKVKVTQVININKLYKANELVMIYPTVTGITKGVANNISQTVINLRHQLRMFYQTALSSPSDGIVTGVVLGDKSLIPKDFWDKLKLTGTLHIMVASGMNIALFSETVLKFFCLLVKRKQAVILLYLLIWFYVLLSGVTPPVVRAAVMASLIYLGQLTGREYNIKRILWLTGGIMVVFVPRLLFDVGFQLSFLATMGLIYLQPSITKLQKYFFLFKYASFSSSVAAIIMTLPILVKNFGQLNVVSPIVNLSVLWLMPFILLGGGLFGIIGLIFPYIAKYLVLLLFPATFYLEQVINMFAKMTVFQVQIPNINLVFWLVYYGIIWGIVKKPLSFRALFNTVKKLL